LEIDIENSISQELQLIRSDLLELIQNILIRLEENLTKEGYQGEYNLFSSNLNKSDTIITFNWDLLLDNILHRKQILEGKYKKNQKKVQADKNNDQYLNFIKDISAFKELLFWGDDKINFPYMTRKSNKGYYLKLHGSIDWLNCTNINCRAQNKVFPALTPNSEYFCSECRNELSLLLIPPVLNKKYKIYPIIDRIWNLAVTEMKAVDELIIWGYSLPPTDFYASWLLHKARNANLKKIVLINPAILMNTNPEKKKFRMSLIKHFFDIYSNCVEKENVFLFESYKDYNQNISVFDKGYKNVTKAKLFKKL
jgi:inorganic pyrophosphatase